MTDPGALRYDRRTIALHWATAVLVAVLWIMGQTADNVPKGPWRSAYWSSHVILGFTLAAVLIARIVWRARGGRALPAADRGALHLFAKATHYVLYLLLIAVVSLGIANAFVRGFNLFGAVALPQIGDPDLRRPINHWHELAANMVFFLALFHAAAALVHHYLWRDGLLTRMALSNRRGPDRVRGLGTREPEVRPTPVATGRESGL